MVYYWTCHTCHIADVLSSQSRKMLQASGNWKRTVVGFPVKSWTYVTYVLCSWRFNQPPDFCDHILIDGIHKSRNKRGCWWLTSFIINRGITSDILKKSGHRIQRTDGYVWTSRTGTNLFTMCSFCANILQFTCVYLFIQIMQPWVSETGCFKGNRRNRILVRAPQAADVINCLGWQLFVRLNAASRNCSQLKPGGLDQQI